MATHFKDLYRRYMEKGLPSSDLREFKKELDHIPDEELWNKHGKRFCTGNRDAPHDEKADT